MNKYAESVTNPTVQPDGETEMKVPIPCRENVEFSKEWGEEHETWIKNLKLKIKN